MDFTALIRLSNNLDALTVQDLQQSAAGRSALIMHQSDLPAAGIADEYRQRLAQANQQLQSAVESLETALLTMKQHVSQQIDQQGQIWMQRNYAAYEKQLSTRFYQTPEALGLHRNRPTVLMPEVAEMLNGRVRGYSDWHYPALIVHPMDEPFMDIMVACDPLYVVDESQWLLEPVLGRYTEAYQNRLRSYLIEESLDQPLLSKLPDQQLGFALVYNYLDYRPFELVKNYMSELYAKLAPGGVLAMTFNDCDRYQAITSVEQGLTGYTPGRLVRGWANFLGFEEVFCHQDRSNSVWIEFKRPGTLTSLRGGQALARINPK